MTHPAPASMDRRLLAFLADQGVALLLGGGYLVATLIPAAISSAGGETLGGSAEVSTGALTAAWILVGLQTLVQGWFHGTRGWTLGRWLFQLRTVDVRTGRPVGLVRILARGVVVAAGSLVCGVGQLAVLASPLIDPTGRNRGWHDRVAGDEVVDLRTGTTTFVGTARPVLRARTEVSSAPGRAERVARGPLRDGDWSLVTVDGAAPVRSRRELTADTSSAPASTSAPVRAHVPSAVHVADAYLADPHVADVRVADALGGTDPQGVDPRGAVSHRLGALLGERPPVPGLVLPPLGEPGLSPDFDTRALPILQQAVFGLDPSLEQTRRSPLRADERPSDPPDVHGDIIPSAAVELSDGRVVQVRASALVGRNPMANGSSQIVRIVDPGRSVSKTHFELGVDSAGVWVADRGSTNGTLVTLADGQQIACGSDHAVRLSVGSTVAFGDCGLRVIRAPGASPRS